MNVLTLSKRKMLEYQEAKLSIPQALIRDVEERGLGIPLEDMKVFVAEEERIRDAIADSDDDWIFILPNATMTDINGVINRSKLLA